MEATKVLTPLQKKIEKLKAETQAKLDKEIAILTREDEAKEARKELQNDIKRQIKEFEMFYGVNYIETNDQVDEGTPTKLTVLEKCKIVEKETIDGKPKYKLSDDGKSIIGAKGEPIRSIIKFDDDSNNKQTLGVTTYYKYLKPDVTKEELDKLFGRKDIVQDKLRDGTLTDDDKRILKM